MSKYKVSGFVTYIVYEELYVDEIVEADNMEEAQKIAFEQSIPEGLEGSLEFDNLLDGDNLNVEVIN